MMTNPTWSRKLKPSKECVTTQGSNLITPKMDGAETKHRSQTVGGVYKSSLPSVEGRGVNEKGFVCKDDWNLL